MNRFKRPVCSMLIVSLMLAPPTVSANVGNGMQTWFDSMGGFSNTTPPTSWKGQTQNGYSFGSFYARTPVRSYQLANMTPPSLDIGCGGIDLHAGSFSFINKDAIIGLFNNIGTSLSYAFLLAIKSSMPEMASLFETLQDVANKVNSLNVNSCKWASGLDLKKGASVSENVTSAFTQVAGAATNQFSDVFGSWNATKADAGQKDSVVAAAVAQKPGNKDHILPGNVVWKALQKVQGIDDQDRLMIMSLTGTIVIHNTGTGGAPVWIYSGPTNVQISDFIGDTNANTGIDVYSCGTDPDCMSPTLPATQTVITPFVKKVDDALNNLITGVTSRSAQGLNNFKLVDAAQSLPVWKLISVTADRNPEMVRKFERIIAVDIAYSYINGLYVIANQALANVQNGNVPDDARDAIDSLRRNLSELQTHTFLMRNNEYQKVSAQIDIERQIQLLHQTLLAGIPSQAFTSMAVFGGIGN